MKRSSSRIYWLFLLSLITVHPPKLGDEPSVNDLAHWKKGELQTLVEVAQRQLARQVESLDRVLSRAQLLFTTHLALIALYVGVAQSIWQGVNVRFGTVPPRVALVLAFSTLVLALLGAVAILSVRKEFDDMHADVLARWPSFDARRYAREYVECVTAGERTANAHLTVFGTSVRITLFSVISLGAAWLMTR